MLAMCFVYRVHVFHAAFSDGGQGKYASYMNICMYVQRICVYVCVYIYMYIYTYIYT